MPWFDLGTRRHRPEAGASIQDLWTGLRILREHAGGIFNTVATIALAVSRLDARLETLGADVALLRSAVQELLPLHGPGEDVYPDEHH